MIHLSLNGHGGKALQVLCLGSHSDDIEIGCGGTILKLAQEHPQAVFHWVVFSAPGIRQEEALCAARMFAGERLMEPLLKTFPDAFMPFVGDEVKAVFEELKKQISPDLIFTQNRRDAHQDHRLIAELTWNTFRDHLILEYEIPKYDGDLGQPNVFFPLSHELCNRKLEYIMAAFRSQRNRRWFEEETFRALMRIRGMECNAESGYAEAFYCRKAVMLGA
jgi:LmbE family N-acetylglucosaminyl deacetylase